MSEQIWVSRGLSDGSIRMPFRDPDTALTFRERVRLIDSVKRGTHVDAALLPSRLIFDDPHHDVPTTVYDVFVDSYLCVSEPVMQVISRFEVGDTHFFPISLLDKKQEPITTTPYFGVAFAETRPTVGGGRGLIENTLRPGEFNLDSPLEDGAVEILPAFEIGPDIWVDSCINGAIFMSDRLRSSLQASGFADRFSLKRCSVAEEQV